MNQLVITENISEGLEVISRPINADVGLKSLSSFHLSVTAMTPNYEDVEMVLYAHNSRSIPYHPDMTNVWSPLKPQWRFVYADSNETLINERAEITFHTELVSGGEVVGAVGDIEFYYIDDMPTEVSSPVMLFATLDAGNYYDKDLALESIFLNGDYNSEMSVIMPFYILPLAPAFIRFTQNGRNELHPYQWSGLNIQSYATIHGMPNHLRYVYDDIHDMRNYPILFSYPTENTTLNYKLDPLSGGSFTYSSQFSKAEIGSGHANGGWAPVNITAYENSPKATLVGTADITYDPNVIAQSNSQSGVVWVSNAASNTLHKITSIVIDPSLQALSGILTYKADKVHFPLVNEFLSVPSYSEESYPYGHPVLSNAMELSGYSGIYAIAISPDTSVWTADFELDRIYKRNDAGEIIETIDLQLLNNIPQPYELEYSWYGPNSISIDSTGTVYCSLYNSVSCVRIDSEAATTTFFAPSGSELSASNTPLSAGNNELNLLRPVKVVCDKNNGVHVAYGNSSRSAFAHFDSDQVVQNSQWVDTSGQYSLTDFVILKSSEMQDNIVAAMYGTDISDIDGIYKFTYDYSINEYTEPELLVECSHPYYLTFDRDEKIWFAYDNNKIGKLPSLSAISPSGMELSEAFVMEIPVTSELSDKEVIGGMCFDKTNYVNVLDSYSNNIYRWHFTQDTTDLPNRLNGVKIYPNRMENIVNDSGTIETVSGSVPSLRAFGDWSGFIYEYTYSLSSAQLDNITASLSGSSIPFLIDSIASEYGIRRFNDSWDMTAQIKSYIYPDYQQQFVSLWDDLIGNIVGNASSDYLTFGRQIYEKISNFVINHSSIDSANISQLYAMFENIGLEYKNYDISYPAELKHWMNVLSISFEKLKGEQFKCNRNFLPKSKELTEFCSTCGKIHPTNLGERIYTMPKKITVSELVYPYTYFNGDYHLIDVSPDGFPSYLKDENLRIYYDTTDEIWILKSDISDIFRATAPADSTTLPPRSGWQTMSLSTSAPSLYYPYPFMEIGVPVIIEDSFMSKNQFDIFYPPISGDFSQLEEYGFRASFFDQYNVYEFIDSPSTIFNEQSEGLVNWLDEYNRLEIQNTNVSDWFKSNGEVEKIFLQALYKNVFKGEAAYYTDESVSSSLGWNDINVFLESDVIEPDFNVVFDRTVPLTEIQTSPVSKYAIPIYKPLNSSEAIEFSATINNPIYDSGSVASTDKFLFLTMGDNLYYIPLYTDRFGGYQLTPVYGTGGIHLNYTIVDNPNRMTEFAYIGFNYQGEMRFVPIYTCPVAPEVLVPPKKIFKISWEEWINQ